MESDMIWKMFVMIEKTYKRVRIQEDMNRSVIWTSNTSSVLSDKPHTSYFGASANY